MNELHDRVRAALHDALDGVPLHPDERDVGRRVAARRRRRTATRVAVVGAAAAAAVTGMVLTNSGLADRGTATIPSSTTTVAVPETFRVEPTTCTPPAELPFQPSFLPAGWRAGSYDPTTGFTLWARKEVSGSYSAVIEVSIGGRGDAVTLLEPIETITVLGREARLADISDGYAVIVDLGPTPCDRWTLLAHPSATRGELRAVAEGLVTTVVPAPAPSTTIDVTDAAVPTGYRVVTRVGTTLVEVSSTGEQRQVAVLPEVPGVDPVLWAAGDRLVVTYLGRTLLYDTTTWAPPVELGEYLNLGIATDGDGYWAADPFTSPPTDGMLPWRRYGWDGVASGPVTPALQYPLPVGALDGGIALWEKGTQRLLVSTDGRVEDLGKAIPAAARGHLVAFATATDEVRVHDVSTGTTRSIALGPTMKVDVAMSGALSADGRRLALLVNSERPADAAIVLVDLADDTARVVLTGARVLDWSADSRTALFARGDTLLALDVASGEIAELPLPPGASPGLVVLAP